MAVTLPPWLNIDPIAPARIRLQANAQRNAAAASERAAQAQSENLQFRREQAASEQAAQERSAQRRDEVLKQTNDRELAQAAQQIQLRREAQAQKADQFQQTLRMKQQAAEVEAKNAAQQMQGMKALQEGLKNGRPMQELLAENAPMLFAGKANQAVGALQRGSRVAPVPDYVAHELKDEQGNPTGVKVRRGAGGSIVPLPRTTMSPEGMLNADKLRLGILTRQLEDDPKNPQLLKARDAIMARLEQITSGRGAATPPAGAAPASNTVRVKKPDGTTGSISRAKWESYSKEQKKGWEEIAAPGESDFTEESDAQAPTPEDDEEE